MYKKSLEQYRSIADRILAGEFDKQEARVSQEPIVRRPQARTEPMPEPEVNDDIMDIFLYLKKEQKEMSQKSEQPKRSGRTRAAGVSFGGYNKLIDLIDRTEGGGEYDTLFGFSQREGKPFAGVDVTQMTIGELKEFTAPSGEYGQWVKQQLANSGQRARVATPMGRYQIVGSTLRDTAKRMGLSDDTVFSPEVQDQMFLFLARESLERGGKKALRGTWEGFKHVSDAELDAAIDEFLSETSLAPRERPTVKEEEA